MGWFRKKPVVIEAVRWDGSAVMAEKIATMSGAVEGVMFDAFGGPIVIRTLEGDMTAQVGDWVIKGLKGELYPCKPDIFEATYEAVQ